MNAFRKSDPRSARLLVTLVVLLCLVSISFSTLPPSVVKAQSATFRNPLNSSGPDPWMTYYNGNYYLMSTQWTTLRMWRAPTIAALKTASPVTVWNEFPAERCCNVWAPEFHLLNGPNGLRWYIYYSAGPSGTCCDGQRVWVLESSGTDPLGPYSFRGKMVDSNNHWGIDGSILQLNGALYFIYSGVDQLGGEQNTYIAPMSNPWTLSGPRVRISTPSQSWERAGSPVQEGPVALQRNGRTFIIYSASSCSTADYKLGLLTLTGTNPLSASAWTKSPNPVFQRSNTNGVFGPGHNGFFKSPDGTQDWIVYHANSSSTQGCGSSRTTRIQQFTWNADGSPNFGTPVSTNTDLAVPSGETGGGGPTPTPTRTPTPIPGGNTFRIVNRNSGKCLDVNGASQADGANIIQWTCGNGQNQRWRVEDLGGGFSRLAAVHSGKVADVANCGTADGADIRQWTWLNNNCQQWQLITTTSPWVRIVNRNSGRVFDVANCGTGDGADVRQWTWLNNNCQQWQLQP